MEDNLDELFDEISQHFIEQISSAIERMIFQDNTHREILRDYKIYPN